MEFCVSDRFCSEQIAPCLASLAGAADIGRGSKCSKMKHQRPALQRAAVPNCFDPIFAYCTRWQMLVICKEVLTVWPFISYAVHAGAYSSYHITSNTHTISHSIYLMVWWTFLYQPVCFDPQSPKPPFLDGLSYHVACGGLDKGYILLLWFQHCIAHVQRASPQNAKLQSGCRADFKSVLVWPQHSLSCLAWSCVAEGRNRRHTHTQMGWANVLQ